MDHVLHIIRRSMGPDALGVDRGTVGADGDSLPGTYRHYQAEMRREFKGEVPTLGLVMGAAFASATATDAALERDLRTVLARTMTGMTGSAGGFALPTGMSVDVFDKARMTIGIWSFVNFWPVKTRTYTLPVVSETSRARGSRWGGGPVGYWNYGETSMPPATTGKVAARELTMKRLIAQSIVSNDLMADSERFNRWLQYTGISELRQCVEDALIWGPSSYDGSPAVGPEGVMTAASTVVVAKDSGQAAGTITQANVNNLWQAIAAGNRTNAAWFASCETIDAIDQLAVSGTWPLALYMPAGLNPAWPTFATIKGRPLIPCSACPTLGASGDLVCADFSDYVFGYLQPSPTAGPLGFGFRPPDDKFHKGMVGLPDDGVETRLGDQVPGYWDSDESILSWKLRGDGAWLWASTVTSPTGITQGPAAILAAR